LKEKYELKLAIAGMKTTDTTNRVRGNNWVKPFNSQDDVQGSWKSGQDSQQRPLFLGKL
jgi:hypothetical protein